MEQSVEPTPYRMEIIGEYQQAVREVFNDRDGNAIVIEPGPYPVVASVSQTTNQVSEGGVILNGKDIATGTDRTVVQFHDRAQLLVLVQNGDLELAENLSSKVVEELAVVVPDRRIVQRR